MPAGSVLRVLAAARGIAYAIGFVALWTWLATIVRPYDSQLPLAITDTARPLGIALMLVGAFIAFACVAVFATRGAGTPAPFDAPRVFVASGPYRFVRNPMYLGAAAVVAGAGLIWRSVSILLLAGAFLAFFHLFVLFYEEPTLRHRFGDSYAAYNRSVHRWLPRPFALLGAVVAVGAIYLAILLLFPHSPAPFIDNAF